MVFTCSVDGCRSNYSPAKEIVPVFSFPKDEDTCSRWVKFAAGTRKSWTLKASSRICQKHFEPKYVKVADDKGRCRLVKSLKPVPTILDPDSNDSPEVAHMKAPVSVPRRSPRKRLFQEDEYKKFMEDDLIRSYSDINEKMTPAGYTVARFDQHIVFYRVSPNELSALETHEQIRIDNDLHVKLFYKGSPVPLPEWFRKGRDCRLTRKSMLQNLPNYVKMEGEQTSHIFKELKEIQFQKKPKYSNNIIRYALLLRYTSVQAYRLVAQDFRLPSLSFLRRITEGGIDTMKAMRKLKDTGKLSKDVVLIFDEMYLQKCEEYFAGKLIGANEKK